MVLLLMLFRWRAELGLVARKAPQLATVTLADGAPNEVPALAALRDLVRPPDGMIAIELEGAMMVFPQGSDVLVPFWPERIYNDKDLQGDFSHVHATTTPMGFRTLVWLLLRRPAVVGTKPT